MSRLMLLSLALIGFINSSNIPKVAATLPATYQSYDTYVQKACNWTTYPLLCYKSLSSYSSTIKSDPIKLCTTSLSHNVKAANNATSIVSNLLKKAKLASSPDVPILKECLEEMKYTVDELKQSITEMKNLRGGRKSAEECLTNMKTWVSSALTDEGTCTDDFEEGNVDVETMRKVKKAVTKLSRTTSNTLALITKYPRY